MKARSVVKIATVFLAIVLVAGCGILLRAPRNTAKAQTAAATTDYSGLNTVEVWLQSYKEDRDTSEQLGSEANPYQSVRDLAVDACSRNEPGEWNYTVKNVDGVTVTGILGTVDLSAVERIFIHVTGDASVSLVAANEDDHVEIASNTSGNYLTNGMGAFFINNEGKRYPSADASRILLEFRGELCGEDPGTGDPLYPVIYYMSTSDVLQITDDVVYSGILSMRCLGEDEEGTVRRHSTVDNSKLKAPNTLYLANDRCVFGPDFQLSTVASSDFDTDVNTLAVVGSPTYTWNSDWKIINGVGTTAAAASTESTSTNFDRLITKGKNVAILGGTYGTVYAFGRACYPYDASMPHVFTIENATVSSLYAFHSGAELLPGPSGERNKFTVNAANVTVTSHLRVSSGPSVFTYMKDGEVHVLCPGQSTPHADMEYNLTNCTVGSESSENGARFAFFSASSEVKAGDEVVIGKAVTWTGDLTVNIDGGTYSTLTLLGGNASESCRYQGDAVLNFHSGTVLNYAAAIGFSSRVLGGSATVNVYGGTFGRGTENGDLVKGLIGTRGAFKDNDVSFPVALNVYSGDISYLVGALAYDKTASRNYEEVTVLVQGDSRYAHPQIDVFACAGGQNQNKKKTDASAYIVPDMYGKINVEAKLYGGLGSDDKAPNFGSSGASNTDSTLGWMRACVRSTTGVTAKVTLGDPLNGDAGAKPTVKGSFIGVSNWGSSTFTGEVNCTFDLNGAELYMATATGRNSSSATATLKKAVLNLNSGKVKNVYGAYLGGGASSYNTKLQATEIEVNVKDGMTVGDDSTATFVAGATNYAVLGKVTLNISGGAFGANTRVYGVYENLIKKDSKTYQSKIDELNVNITGGTFQKASAGFILGGCVTSTSLDSAITDVGLDCGKLNVKITGGTFPTDCQFITCRGWNDHYGDVTIELGVDFPASSGKGTDFYFCGAVGEAVTADSLSITVDEGAKLYRLYPLSGMTDATIGTLTVTNRGTISGGLYPIQSGTKTGRVITTTVVNNYGSMNRFHCGYVADSSTKTHYNLAHVANVGTFGTVTYNNYDGTTTVFQPIMDCDVTVDTLNLNVSGGTVKGVRMIWNKGHIDNVNVTLTGGSIAKNSSYPDFVLCYGDGGTITNATVKFLGGTVTDRVRFTRCLNEGNYGSTAIGGAIIPDEMRDGFAWEKSVITNANFLLDGATLSAAFTGAFYENSEVTNLTAVIKSGTFATAGYYAAQCGTVVNSKLYLVGGSFTHATTRNITAGLLTQYGIDGTVEHAETYLLGANYSEPGEALGGRIFGTHSGSGTGEVSFWTNGGSIFTVEAGASTGAKVESFTATFSTGSYHLVNEALGLDQTIPASPLTIGNKIDLSDTCVTGDLAVTFDPGFSITMAQYGSAGTAVFGGTVTGTLDVSFTAVPSAAFLVKVPAGTPANVGFAGIAALASSKTEGGMDVYYCTGSEPRFAGRTLILDSAFSVRYLIPADDYDAIAAAGFTVTSLDVTVDGASRGDFASIFNNAAVVVNGIRYYWVTVDGIAPKDIGTPIVLTLNGSFNDVQTSDVYEDSVAAALAQVVALEGGQTAFGKAAQATLEYCQAAADAFGVEASYWTDDSAALTDAAVPAEFTSYKYGLGDVNFIGTSLILKDELAIQFWADASDYSGSIDDLIVKINGTDVTSSVTKSVNSGSKGYWTFKIGIPIDRIATALTIELFEGDDSVSNQYTDSVQNFAVCMIDAKGAYATTGEQKAIGQAILNYSSYVNAYLGNFNADPADDGVLRVLLIGNSFCYYWPDELYGMLAADGYTSAKIYNVYKSGCYVSEHWNWYEANEAHYQCYVNDAEGRRRAIPGDVTLRQCMELENWDVISIQQHFNPTIAATYESALESVTPYAGNLIRLLGEKFPSARLYWHETWAYQVGYDRFEMQISDVATQTNQYNNIRDVSHYLSETYNIPISPNGDAWQIARGLVGDVLCNRDLAYDSSETDCYHDGSVGGGQYLNACVWFEMITGKSCVGNTYRPNYTKDLQSDIDLLQQAAHQAVTALYN